MRGAKKRVASFSLVAAFAPVGSQIPGHYERFREMLFSSRIEDAFTTQASIWNPRKPVAAIRPVFSTLSAPQFLTSDQRAEWAVRLGVGRSGLKLSDLNQIGSVELLDEALWVVLEKSLPDFLEGRPSAEQSQKDLAAVLAHEIRRAELFRQRHGDWWHYLSGDRLSAMHDPLLAAVINLQAARNRSGVPRAAQLLEGRSHLVSSLGESYLESYDNGSLKVLRPHFKDPKAIAWAIASVPFTRPEIEAQKIPLLQKLVAYWTELGESRLAADALSHVQVLALKSGDKANPTDILATADLELEAGEYALALNFYRKAVELSESGDRSLHAKALAGRAVAAEKNADAQSQGGERRDLYEWAAEYYRLALQENFGTENSNLLLERYGVLLSRLGRSDAALDIYETLFRAAQTVSFKTSALGFATAIIERGLENLTKSERPAQRLAIYRRYLGYLSFWSELEPKSPALLRHLSLARRWQSQWGWKGDDAITASLYEIEHPKK